MMKGFPKGAAASIALISNLISFSTSPSSAFLIGSLPLVPIPTSSRHYSFCPRVFSREKHHSLLHQKLPSDMEIFHYPKVNSTQDQMKIILKDNTQHTPNAFVAITASEQTNGRGTNGRTWIGHLGNTFLTIAIPSSELEVPPSLLPLQMGTIVTERIHQLLRFEDEKSDVFSSSFSKPRRTLNIKWPNDVLLNDCKISGILIESDLDYDKNYYFLIGIGINYQCAPDVDLEGPQRGRKATCICNHIDCKDMDTIQCAKDLGVHIAKDVKDWVQAQKGWDGAADAIIQNWERWAVFGQKLILRDDPINSTVIPIGIEKDGRLRVKNIDGKEQLLCFDYLL